MQTQLLEARVLSIVDAVLAGRQVEDDRVELKAAWPTAEHKTARQIAGHANASGGEAILWIIGLDEKGCRFGDTSGVEPSAWWGSIARHFLEVEPEFQMFRVPVAGNQDVIALQFSTDRAPYVVKTPEGGTVESEVPWRAGNATRTARRHEMIRSIVAEASVPTLELVGGTVEIDKCINDPHVSADDPAVGSFRVQISLSLFVSTSGSAYLPEHRQSMTLTGAGATFAVPTFSLAGSYRYGDVGQSGRRSKVPFGNVRVLGRSGVEVAGPGEASLRSELRLSAAEGQRLVNASTVVLDLVMPVDRSDRVVRLKPELPWVRTGEGDIPGYNDQWQTEARFALGARATGWT